VEETQIESSQATSPLKPFVKILSILFLVAAIPLTVFLAQQQQTTQQHAAGEETSREVTWQIFVTNHTNHNDQGTYIDAGALVGYPVFVNWRNNNVDPSDGDLEAFGERWGQWFIATGEWRCGCDWRRYLKSQYRAGTGETTDLAIPGPTDTPAPAPTATPIPPTPTNTPAPTAVPTLGATSLNISLGLTGVGIAQAANQTPLHPTRNVTVCLYPSSVDPSGDPGCSKTGTTRATGTVAFDTTSKNFTNASFMLPSSVTTGQYSVLIKTDDYLRKRAGFNTLSITAGTNNTIPGVILPPGDVDGNNALDALDYNDIFINCWTGIASSMCQNKASGNHPGADINDDGKVDHVDYVLFQRAISTQAGD
jgi:hypothetical protein